MVPTSRRFPLYRVTKDFCSSFQVAVTALFLPEGYSLPLGDARYLYARKLALFLLHSIIYTHRMSIFDIVHWI